MDFSALMQAASNNKAQALGKVSMLIAKYCMYLVSVMTILLVTLFHTKIQKEPVLKTKLAAPKKEEKKVDVAAIRRRLEEGKKPPAVTVKPKKPAIQSQPTSTISKVSNLLRVTFLPHTTWFQLYEKYNM